MKSCRSLKGKTGPWQAHLIVSADGIQSEELETNLHLFSHLTILMLRTYIWNTAQITPKSVRCKKLEYLHSIFDTVHSFIQTLLLRTHAGKALLFIVCFLLSSYLKGKNWQLHKAITHKKHVRKEENLRQYSNITVQLFIFPCKEVKLTLASITCNAKAVHSFVLWRKYLVNFQIQDSLKQWNGYESNYQMAPVFAFSTVGLLQALERNIVDCEVLGLKAVLHTSYFCWRDRLWRESTGIIGAAEMHLMQHH